MSELEYKHELQIIEKLKKQLCLNVKYPYIIMIHKKDYDILGKEVLVKDSFYDKTNEKIDIDIQKENVKNDCKENFNSNDQDVFINKNVPSGQKNNEINNFESNTKELTIKIVDVVENSIDIKNNILPERQKNTESNILFSRIKNYYYKYYDKYLPERQNISEFKNINKNIKKRHKINIMNIIEYYNLYEKFKDHNKEKECSSTFYKYIEYNNTEFSKYFCHFYEKVKKCHNFINYFIQKGILEDKIITILYRSNLTYNILYKIRGDDYDNLKKFFTEKLFLLNIENNNDKIISDSKIKRTTNKESLITYIGTKHDYTENVNKKINVDSEAKIYDLFCGSCSLTYPLYKIYQNNKFIINDVNEFLLIFYDQVKNNNENLLSKIKELNTENNIKNYENLLNIINDPNTNNLYKAAVYYILSKISYNGKIFIDKFGLIKIHSYNKKSIKIDDSKFISFKKFLEKNEINNKDVIDYMDYWLDRIKENDVVLLDPPYDILDKQNNHYIKDLNRERQEKLCMFINKLVEKKVYVLLFNGNTLFIKKLYKNLNIEIIKSNTKINCNRPYNELLFYN